MKDPKVTEIRNIALLRECRPADVQWIARVADTVDVPAGRTIVYEGQSIREFVVLVHGSAARDDGAVTLAPGAHFGELGLIDGGRHAHTVETQSAARLLVFSPGAYRGMLGRIPSVGRKLLAEKVTRLRATNHDSSRSLRAVS